MAIDQSEEKTFKIYTTEHKGYSVKAKSLKEAIDIFIDADLTPKDSRLELYECGDLRIWGIRDGSEWIGFNEMEDKLEKAQREEVNKMGTRVKVRVVSCGGSGEEECPLCGAWMSTAYESCDHEFVTGICVECGYYYWTEPGVARLEYVNKLREPLRLEALNQLKIDLKALDQLRLKHGLEPLQEVSKNWRKTLRRIKKEVVPQDPTKKE